DASEQGHVHLAVHRADARRRRAAEHSARQGQARQVTPANRTRRLRLGNTAKPQAAGERRHPCDPSVCWRWSLWCGGRGFRGTVPRVGAAVAAAVAVAVGAVSVAVPATVGAAPSGPTAAAAAAIAAAVPWSVRRAVRGPSVLGAVRTPPDAGPRS